VYLLHIIWFGTIYTAGGVIYLTQAVKKRPNSDFCQSETQYAVPGQIRSGDCLEVEFSAYIQHVNQIVAVFLSQKSTRSCRR